MLNLIKNGVPSSTCLGIGDGANDVAMIKAGHVGVGIIGKEGREAVNNSDFAIAQFRFLRQLLLVHGRYNHRRVSVFSYYMFYKNGVVVLVMFFYSLLGMASSTRLFTEAFWQSSNLLYTSLPIVIYGINDKDLPKSIAASQPRAYSVGIQHTRYTHVKFAGWMMECFYAGAL